jgi:photosystem II stability/assembly factor-like uncharacterized protein
MQTNHSTRPRAATPWLACALASVALASAAGAAKAPAKPAAPAVDAAVISGLGARNIGSAQMSGRISAIAGRLDDDGKVTLFVGAASGGVWRSMDGGTTFRPVFDSQPVQSIGAIALDPNDKDVVWVGTGESWTRNSVSVGDGIYKSTDGGETWAHVGLPNSERVNRIIVSPKDGNVVYACVPGKLWSDSADRGLYKTTDGGKTWALVLKGPNLSTGCSGLTMDPRNPDRLFAGLWDFRRKGWTFRSGGDGPDAPSGSGLFVTEDGGKTWKSLDAKSAPGLPAGPWGRLDVAIAPSQPDVVYAVIEGVHSALYRSADGGRTWEARDDSRNMVWRPFYFSRLVIDPTNADRLFKPNLRLIASDDGGRSFTDVGGGTHGDHHDLWINPRNPKYVVTGDDGGLWISYDGGNKWVKSLNLPVSQFYHVSVDERDPYQVYGGLQDNSSWVADSQYPGGITNSRWENLYGGDGFWAFSDPADPNYAYAEYQGGTIARINRHTLEQRNIQPRAGYHEKLRFNWNTPIHLSPNEKGKIYIGSQFLFASRDHGQSWARISPDLTTNDPAKQKQEESGGITVDNSAAEMHTTIYSISESPRHADEIWVGTDDGNVQLTRDGGKSWTNVVGNVKGLPAASWVSWVEAGHHADGVAYAAFDRHTYGDVAPWVYRTRDYGRTWTRIVAPEQGVRGYAHVIREDPVNPDLLYLGTEFGLWISIDGGTSWARFEGSRFPAVAVRDIAIHPRDRDLVVATHGRGIWIIDDVTPLRALKPADLGQDLAFLDARPIEQRIQGNGGWAEGDATFAGQNPPNGAVITYYQRARHVFGRLKVEVLDASGRVVDTLAAGKRKGINRVVWSMQEKPPRVPTAAQAAFSGTQGPRVLPGRYTVRITKGDHVYERPLEVGLDRRAAFSLDDRRAQYAAAMRAHALFGRMSDLVDRLNGLRMLAAQRAKALPEGSPVRADVQAFAGRVDDLRKKVVATKEGGAITGEERLREHLDYAYGSLLSYEGRPGDYQVERVAVLDRELADVEKDAQSLVEHDLPALNGRLTGAGAQPIASAEAVEEGARFAALRSLEEARERTEAAAANRREERD